MKKICIVYGGDSLENEISILTALKIKKDLDKYSYQNMLVYLDRDGNFYTGDGLLNKSNYPTKTKFKKGFFIRKNRKNIFLLGHRKKIFDYVLLLCHGAGAEDGSLRGYFDTLKIDCISPDLTESALMQDKYLFKLVLKELRIPQVNYALIKENELNSLKEIDEKLTYPLILKPNRLGSSIGVTKVLTKEELINGVYDAFSFDKSVLVEECVEPLVEINVALIRKGNEIVVSELERVNNKDKILTFMDKYDNYQFNESHVIPADIDKKTAKKIIYYSKKVYEKLDLSTVVRFDYLYNPKTHSIYFNEANAIPGSLAYYLFEPQNILIVDLIDIMIEQYENSKKEKQKRMKSYHEELLSSLKDKA